MNQLRLLNFDDLFLLKYLASGLSLTSIAHELKLTQPAISQRLRKIEQIFSVPVVEKRGRELHLTKEGQAICKRAADALELMNDIGTKNSSVVINLGTRPEAGRSWLWPAVLELRRTHPQIRFHMSFGSGSEILAQLGVGKLDVVLTSAPLTTRSFRAIELLREDYCLVANPAIAKKIKKIEDLEQYAWIEHDRSFPFLRYIDAHLKPQLKFKDIWFLESTEIMASALAEGEGVGIIPSYIAKRFLTAKKLVRIKLDLKIASDKFRLVYRADRQLGNEIQLLADHLIKSGLT